jgi:hypothetical protein
MQDYKLIVFSSTTNGDITDIQTNLISTTAATVNFSSVTVDSYVTNTVSATTYQNLPLDIRVTGGTYNNLTGIATFTNNTGGTFNVSGFSNITSGSSVSGFNTEIQFNDVGSFGAENTLTYDKNLNRLTVGLNLVSQGQANIIGNISGGSSTLTFEPLNAPLILRTNVNDYSQLVLQNKNNGATSSANLVVGADDMTDTTNFLSIGRNSTGFNNTTPFNLSKASYIESQGGDLVIGTLTNNSIKFVINNASVANIEIGTNGELQLLGRSDFPLEPPTNKTNIFNLNILNIPFVSYNSSLGVRGVLQEHFYYSRIMVAKPSGGATLSSFGIGLTSVGTLSTPNMAITNYLTQIPKTRFTSAATAGSLTSLRGVNSQFWRGNSNGLGGFYFSVTIGLSGLQNGMRAFFGITTAPTVAATNIDPLTSTTNGVVGMAINTNTGNWNLVHNNAGTAPTVIPLGASAPVNTTSLYMLSLSALPNNTTISYSVVSLGLTGTLVASGVLSSNLPANNIMMGLQMWATNNTTAAAVSWDTNGIYIQVNNN